jgi:preprotein translocase subunit SecG
VVVVVVLVVVSVVVVVVVVVEKGGRANVKHDEKVQLVTADCTIEEPKMV